MIRIAVASTLALALLAPSPAAAQAAPRWKKSADLPGTVAATGLVAGARSGAWLIGYRVPEGGSGLGGAQVSYHYDGRAWRKAPLPKGAQVATLPGLPPTLAASGSAAWALGPGEYEYDDGPGPSTDPCAAPGTSRRLSAQARAAAGPSGVTIKSPSRLYRWKKGRWTAAKTVRDVAVYTLAVRGRHVYAFGLTEAGRDVMLHFDGRAWHRSKAPIHVWEAKTVGGDLLAYGFGAGRNVHQIWRFDGTKWTDARLDRILPPEVEPTPGARGRSTLITAFSSTGRRQLSIAGFVTRDELCPSAEAEFPKAEPFLFHQAAGKWTEDPLKGIRNLEIDSLVPDGRGGLRAVVATAFGHPGDVRAIVHRGPSGVWKRDALPAGLVPTTLAPIPGGGLWAVALGKRSTRILRR